MGCARLIVSLLGLLLVTPLWYFVLFSLLKATNVSDLTWVAFWVYVPASFLFSFAIGVIEAIHMEDKK